MNCIQVRLLCRCPRTKWRGTHHILLQRWPSKTTSSATEGGIQPTSLGFVALYHHRSRKFFIRGYSPCHSQWSQGAGGSLAKIVRQVKRHSLQFCIKSRRATVVGRLGFFPKSKAGRPIVSNSDTAERPVPRLNCMTGEPPQKRQHKRNENDTKMSHQDRIF
jgi:hypothetical protein